MIISKGIKQIVNNYYLELGVFSSRDDLEYFLKNIGNVKVFNIDHNYTEDFHYCYSFCHSLTLEREFVLSFSSDEKAENLNIIFWHERNSLVFDTGSQLYGLNNKNELIDIMEIEAPLIGLYKIDPDKILVLEETFVSIVNNEFMVTKREGYGFIEEFKIRNNELHILTDEGSSTITLK